MLAYLEIKDFPSDVTPILKGATEVLSWYRNGTLSENKRDALLVATNAAAYGAGMGADMLVPHSFGATGDGGESVAVELESKVSEFSQDGVPTVSINPLLIIQIAQLVFQLIKTLKS